MNILGYDISIQRARSLPSGARTSNLRTDVDLASGKLEPRLAETAAPARGPRPHPGPLPVIDPTAHAGAEEPTPDDFRHQPIRWQFPYAVNQVWTPRRNALTPFAILRQ